MVASQMGNFILWQLASQEWSRWGSQLHDVHHGGVGLRRLLAEYLRLDQVAHSRYEETVGGCILLTF